jgi:hypothetical protein
MMRKLLFVTALAGAATTVAFAQSKTPATPAQPKAGTPAQPAGAKAQPPAPMPHPMPAADKPVPGPTEPVTIFNTKKELKWMPAPPSLPPGAEITVMSGNPKEEGPFTMRLRFPAKYKISPHWHPAHEQVTVIEGGLWLAHGETWDDKALKEIPAGGFLMMPPKHGHFAMAKKKTVIQLNGWGPWGVTYFNPSDDPRNAAAATPPAAPATPAAPGKLK